MTKNNYNGYRDIKAYQLSYKLSLELHVITKSFPQEEKYSLVDQIRRSSRSVPANVAEAWKKRKYQKMFINRIIDASGEAGETEVWLDFCKNFGYLDEAKYKKLIENYSEINRMLGGMIDKADKFCY